MIPLEKLPRPLRVATRAAFYTLVICVVVSVRPVWNLTRDMTRDPNGPDRGAFWIELRNAGFGLSNRESYLVHNLILMAFIATSAFLVGAVGFWFGPKVKDKDDEPRRLQVRMWER